MKKLKWYLNHSTFYYYFCYMFPEFDQFAETQAAKINLILAPDHTPEEQQYLFDLLSNHDYDCPEDKLEIDVLIQQVHTQLCWRANGTNNVTNKDEKKINQSLLQKLEPKLEPKLSSTPPSRSSSSSWQKMLARMNQWPFTPKKHKSILRASQKKDTSTTTSAKKSKGRLVTFTEVDVVENDRQQSSKTDGVHRSCL